MSRLDAAIAAALATLREHGVDAGRVVLGVTDAPHPDGTDYATHVGPTRDRDTATLVSLVANDLADEARRASVALIRDENCPNCKSPRLAYLQRRGKTPPGMRPGIYIESYDDCLDCDYRKRRRHE